MITVRMIQYWNDYHKKELKENFKGLRELEEWIFEQMRVNYSSEYGARLLSFPKCDVKDRIYRISVQPEYGSHVFWIKQIEDDYSGIIFSDGTFTAGQKHCTKLVRGWLAGCEKRKNAPTFRFASDGSGADNDLKTNILHGRVDELHMDRNVGDCGNNMIPRWFIMKAAKRIHDVGGSGAEDEYSEGYDAGISVALDILLEEAGCTIDDVLDYDENEED